MRSCMQNLAARRSVHEQVVNDQIMHKGSILAGSHTVETFNLMGREAILVLCETIFGRRVGFDHFNVGVNTHTSTVAHLQATRCKFLC